MQTLDLKLASEMLYASESTVLELVASGEIPAAKVGRKWVFVDIDLIDYIRSQYALTKGKQCHSIKEAKRGGSISLSTDKELDNLLGKPISEKPKKSTTKLSIVPSS